MMIKDCFYTLFIYTQEFLAVRSTLFEKTFITPHTDYQHFVPLTMSGDKGKLAAKRLPKRIRPL